MFRKTYHKKGKKKRHISQVKTQKGGQVGELIVRVGGILTSVLRRLPGSLGRVAATAGPVTSAQATQMIEGAIQNTVQAAVSRAPELSDAVGQITSNIIRASGVAIEQLATATTNVRLTDATPALATIAAAIATGLLGSIAVVARTPEGRESLRRVIQTSIDSVFRTEVAVPPAAAPLVSPFARVLHSPSAPFRPGVTGRRRFAEAVVRHGTRGFSTRAGENGAPVRAPDPVDAEATVLLNQSTKDKVIFSDEEIATMDRPKLVRILTNQWGYTPVPREPIDKLREKARGYMAEARAAQVARFQFAEPPPARGIHPAQVAQQAPVMLPGHLQNTMPTQVLANAAKDAVQTVEEKTAIDAMMNDTKEKAANMYDLIFTSTQKLSRLLTDPTALRDMFPDFAPLADNGADLLPAVLGSSYRAIQAVQIGERNIQGYKILGNRVITDPTLVRSYNENVETTLRFLLERTPRAQVRELIHVMETEAMTSFKIALFDFFLTKPVEALQVLDTIVTHIMPNLNRLPGIMRQITIRLRDNPETVITFIDQMLGRLGTEQREHSNERWLAYQRGVGFAAGRYGVLALGFAGLIFLGAFLGTDSIPNFMWRLQMEMETFSFGNLTNRIISTAEQFYDSLTFAITGRNAEQAITNGVLVPIEGVFGRAQNWWSNFIQAGRPRTFFETMVENITTLTGNINRTHATMFGGAAVLAILLYRSRRARLAANAAVLALPPIPPGNGGPPAPPRNGNGNGGPPAPPRNGNGNGGPPVLPGHVLVRSHTRRRGREAIPAILPAPPRNGNNVPPLPPANNNNAENTNTNTNNYPVPNLPPAANRRARGQLENFNVANLTEVRNARIRAAAAVPLPAGNNE
jgi:hypothetical protein